MFLFPLFTMSTPMELPADIVSCIIEQATINESSLSKLVQLSHINSVFGDSCLSVVRACVRSVIHAFMDDIIMDLLFKVHIGEHSGAYSRISCFGSHRT